jgi:hypothetical protein
MNFSCHRNSEPLPTPPRLQGGSSGPLQPIVLPLYAGGVRGGLAVTPSELFMRDGCATADEKDSESV